MKTRIVKTLNVPLKESDRELIDKLHYELKATRAEIIRQALREFAERKGIRT